jgi:cysteine desulfuration protein SufE
MSGQSLPETVAEIAGDFALLSDWEERYGYVIELGRALAPLSPDERTERNKVRGCASQVWLVTEPGAAPGRLAFRGDSDAHIVRGLIAILLRIFSDRPPAEILAADPKAIFAQLGLADALTPQRSNGLFSMIERIRGDARAATAPAS